MNRFLSDSYDSSEYVISNTAIPTKLSELENDTNFVTAEGMSVYATEEEVRSWLDGYLKKDASSGEESDSDDEYIDESIIDKFKIDNSKVSLEGVKGIRLRYSNGTLSIKPVTQLVSITTSVSSIEYTKDADVIITAKYNKEDIKSLSISGGNLMTQAITTSVTDNVVDMRTPITYSVAYVSTDKEEGVVTAKVDVSKKYYYWYSSNDSETSISTGAHDALLTTKPSSININVPEGQYVYFAFPKSWNVNFSNFKVGGFEFGKISIGDCDGFYGDSDDYTIIRSAQTSLGNITITT